MAKEATVKKKRIDAPQLALTLPESMTRWHSLSEEDRKRIIHLISQLLISMVIHPKEPHAQSSGVSYE
jgi:hypothetical protein